MNKEEFVDNFSIDLTNSTIAERKKYAEKIYNKIDSLQQQVFNKTLTIEGIEKVLKTKEQECLTLTNKINRLEEEKNTLELLLEGKNSQYNAATQECEELKKKKEENEKFYLTKYANKDSYCLKLEHERNIYKQALDEIETLLQDALDTEKTDTQESFDNFYKCLDIIGKAKEQ